jgi:signal peptidase I
MSETISKAGAKPVKKKNELLETVIVIIEALVIALVFRTFLYQPFSIPTASMQSTLMIGDYFIANKWAYGYGKYSFPVPLPINGRFLEFGQPQRGDVVVFNNISGEDYIKRLIGMPGDTVQVKQGRLYINDVMVERKEIGKGTDTDSAMQTVPVTIYEETLPNGVTHVIQEISDDQPLDNTAVYTVPAGHYFMMGDNRDRSADSRVLSQVGYVSSDQLIGRADARFFSIKNNLPPWQLWEWPANVRWDRMFTAINK